VTENAEDFRNLVATQEVHPGLIILPCLGREMIWQLLIEAIEQLGRRGRINDVMVNHVLEIDGDGSVRLFPLPE